MPSRFSPLQADPPETLGESLEASEELLFDFFDFFDRTVDGVYDRLARETGSAQDALNMLFSVYFSLMARRRFFFWKRGAEESVLEALTEKEIAFFRKRRGRVGVHASRDAPIPRLSREEKVRIRVTLLERRRRERMRNVQFVVPFTAAGVAGCFLLFSTVFLPPLSANRALRELAATEVLLLSQEQSFERDLLAAENMLRSIGAHYAERDLARIALALAPPALDKQLTLEAEVQAILWRLGTRPFFLPADTIGRSAPVPPRKIAEEDRGNRRMAAAEGLLYPPEP